MSKIYEELKNTKLVATYSKEGGRHHAVKIGVTNQKTARQAVFGLTVYRGSKLQSVFTAKYPKLMPLFRLFMSSHFPDFKFTSVYVNQNTVAQKHLDSKNTGESVLVGLGSYTGGKTVLYSPNGEQKTFGIKSHSLKFNGSVIWHKSEPFEGLRYSLVFFQIKN